MGRAPSSRVFLAAAGGKNAPFIRRMDLHDGTLPHWGGVEGFQIGFTAELVGTTLRREGMRPLSDKTTALQEGTSGKWEATFPLREGTFLIPKGLTPLPEATTPVLEATLLPREGTVPEIYPSALPIYP